MKRLGICMAALLVAGVLCADEEPTGAKELFGGGSDPTVVASKHSNHKPPVKRPAVQRPFGLSCWIELQDASGKPKRVTHARTFKSGEGIRLHFEPNANGYIAIVQLGASGTSSILFPNELKGLGDNFLRGNADRVLPSEKHWFRFDATPGTEKLLVLFAKTKEELATAFRMQERMGVDQTVALVQTAQVVSGSKDLVIEEVEDDGIYTVNKVGNVVVMNVALQHQ